MATSRRQQRVNHLLHHEISNVLERELDDPRLTGLTVSGVEISPDLRYARVFIVMAADALPEVEARAGLESAKPVLRRELAKRVQLRVMPELDFRFDHSLDYAERIERLLASR
jgi:ribosome-binding factor A